MGRVKDCYFLPWKLTVLSEISCMRLLMPGSNELRSRCQSTVLGTFSGLASWSQGHGRGPKCRLSLLIASTGRVRGQETNHLPQSGSADASGSWGSVGRHVAILISQVQRGLRYASILSSLLSFCILSGKTKVSMGHIQKGDQERNLDQIWLNPNLLITVLEGKHWPGPMVGPFSWSCLCGLVW